MGWMVKRYMTTFFISGMSLYFLTMILVGYFAGRKIKTLDDYLIAGRRLPYFLAVPTIVATWFGAGSCMGVAGTVYSQGFYGVIADPFGCALALMIAGLFFAIPFRRLGLLTISDVLYKSYGPAFERVATLLTIPFYIGTLAANMLAMGYIFQIVSGGSIEWGILLGSLIVLLYTVTGGMWAVTLTDFIQLGILSVGLILIVPICFEHTKDLSEVSKAFVHEFSTLMPSGSSHTHWSAYLGRILMTGLGAIMGQDLIQRLMASRTAKIARASAITAGFLYMALGLIPLFVGIAGREILPNLEKPEQLLPLIAQQYLSPITFTIFACGLLAAIMSTADSYLLAGTSLVVNNLILKSYPIQSEKNKLKLLRWTNIFFALAAFTLATSGPTIFDLMVHSGATLFVSIFIPVCAALFWKSTHRIAAWGALIGGLMAWIGYILFNFSSFLHQYEDMLFSAAIFGVSISLISYFLFFVFTKIDYRINWLKSSSLIKASSCLST
jgi:solute:Na+ symporter, SSS family